MASKKQKAKKAAMQARYNPYVQRIVEDDDLRDNIVQAYESARKAYSRLTNGKSPTKQIFDDKKLQKEIKKAASNVRDASVALHEAPKKSGGLSLKRVLLLGAVGGGIALAVSENLRKKVLDQLFGAEEEFEYTSNTSGTSSPQTTASPN
jgi:O-phosphoseryl-tRNA(Cys) synthetase